MVLKFLAKKGLGLLGKDKTKAIKSVRPGTKFKGQKTVGEIKADMKLKKAQIKLDQTLTKTEKNLKKSAENLKKYLMNK